MALFQRMGPALTAKQVAGGCQLGHTEDNEGSGTRELADPRCLPHTAMAPGDPRGHRCVLVVDAVGSVGLALPVRRGWDAGGVQGIVAHGEFVPIAEAVTVGVAA